MASNAAPPAAPSSLSACRASRLSAAKLKWTSEPLWRRVARAPKAVAGWASDGLTSRPGCLEPPGAARRVPSRRRRRAGALQRQHFEHAEPRPECHREHRRRERARVVLAQFGRHVGDRLE
eukprot:scaffold31440_cov42-Phaeocystis_antarctica.AAC.1